MDKDPNTQFPNNPPPYVHQLPGNASTLPPEPWCTWCNMCVVYQQAGHVPPRGQNHVVVVEQQAQGYFGSEPVVTTCNNFSCRQTVTTVVQENISLEGWLWCLLCFCFFSMIIGLLACCMDGFKKFSHRCPRCNVIIREVKPPLSDSNKCVIASLVGLSVLLLVVLVITVKWWY